MSAWLLNKYEIDVLTHWISNAGISYSPKDVIGATLWSENYRSIRARYGDYNSMDKYLKRPAYHFVTPKPRYYRDGQFFDPYDMDQAFKMCHFYDYQSCETGESYYKSRAYRMISKLMKYLESEGADWQADNLHWGVPNGGYIEDAELLHN